MPRMKEENISILHEPNFTSHSSNQLKLKNSIGRGARKIENLVQIGFLELRSREQGWTRDTISGFC